MKIKICGIRSEDDIKLMNKYHPDFIGFIFFKKSKRYLTPERALYLKSLLNSDIKTVGVFVDEEFDIVLDYYNRGLIDIVQLHGSEDNNYVQKLKKYNIPVIKAIKLAKESDMNNTHNFSSDAFLFDVKNDVLVGGTGNSFNWEYLKNYSDTKPFFLAGGINLNNITNAMKTKADVIDISSGVETNFKKDPIKVKEIFNLFRENNV